MMDGEHVDIETLETAPTVPSNEELVALEAELPVVWDEMVPLGELVSRVAQAIYTELGEMAETLPAMSDAARKRTIADWVVRTKKQVVKLYAIAKWARDADAVQKAMNIIAFLLNQKHQFDDAIDALTGTKNHVAMIRAGNHDILTALDVLTTGTYTRMPTSIMKSFVPRPPLTDDQVVSTLKSIDHAIRYRLRMTELLPVELSSYRVDAGRVWFTAPGLFECSLSLAGTRPHEGWFFGHARFLFGLGGDGTGIQDFPTNPTGVVRQFISDEADARLSKYLPLSPEAPPLPADAPPKPTLPPGVVDAPLVRLFNFLQAMSLSYQLEILWFQAERLRSLGWADYMKVEMARDRKSFTLSYWIRKDPPPDTRKNEKPPPPPVGGKLTFSIAIVTRPPARHRPNIGPASHSPVDRARSRLVERAALAFRASTAVSVPATPLEPSPTPVTPAPPQTPAASTQIQVVIPETAAIPSRPSDTVESLRLSVSWEPTERALNIPIPAQVILSRLPPTALTISPHALDLPAILHTTTDAHVRALLSASHAELSRVPGFSRPGDLALSEEHGAPQLRIRLCADEVVVLSLDSRTGRLALRDAHELSASSRGPRLSFISDYVNRQPPEILTAVLRLRLQTIIEIADQRATSLGLRTFRSRPFPLEELKRFGDAARGMLYVQLARYPWHYLVLVITDERFKYALISSRKEPDASVERWAMNDIGWLDVGKVCGDMGVPAAEEGEGSFTFKAAVLKALYAYCCARVAHTEIEQQLKARRIPYTHVGMPPAQPGSHPGLPAGVSQHIRTGIGRSVPALCVRAADILSGAAAADAAEANVRIVPLHWWDAGNEPEDVYGDEERVEVVTSVKLKYVQPHLAASGNNGSVVRVSKRIIYDTAQAVVSFLSEDVKTCVDEFLEEWAKVSKMVVIAREVAQMASAQDWPDVRLLAFDLITVKFAYAASQTLALTCTHPLLPGGGSYDLRFGCTSPDDHNPHVAAESFLRSILRHGPELTRSLRTLVGLLRDTLPIASALASFAATGIETAVKGPRWYRILYESHRHALDLRLLDGGRVAIIDAAHQANPADPLRDLVLQPIPNIVTIVAEVLKGLQTDSSIAKPLVTLRIGVLCPTSAAGRVGQALHEGILRSFP